MDIEDIMSDAFSTAKEKGWRDDPNRNLPEQLCLMHSEISEALEEYRTGRDITEIRYENDKPEGFPVELADLIIRVADNCKGLGVDLEKAIEIKLAYNKTRPFKHGGKIC